MGTYLVIYFLIKSNHIHLRKIFVKLLMGAERPRLKIPGSTDVWKMYHRRPLECGTVLPQAVGHVILVFIY